MDLGVSRLSSKGSVTIPKEIRDALKLKQGEKFLVFGHGEDIILRKPTPNALNEFKKYGIQVQKPTKSQKTQTLDVNKDPADIYKDILSRAYKKRR